MSDPGDFIIENGVLKRYKGSGGDVTIPESVTSIGNSAFWYCRSLASVTIPDSVTSIGDEAFKYCSSLTSVTIPDSVTSINESAFEACEKVSFSISNEAANRPENFVIKNGVLKKYKGLGGSVVIPEGVTRIDPWAFKRCRSLTSVTIPKSVNSISDRAFYECNCLTSVIIPVGVTSIGDRTFYECSSLTSVTIPDSVTSIGSNAFYGCHSLTSLTIPKELRTIGDRAFYGCSSLTGLTLPKNVRSIGSEAFNGCSGLADKSGFVIVNGALYEYHGSSRDVDIPAGVTRICDNAFRECRTLESATIPDSVMDIGWRAFYNCRNLICVTFLGQVKRISPEAFECCANLRSVSMNEPMDRKMLTSACLYAALNEQEMTELISTTSPKNAKKYWGNYSIERFFETYMASNTRAAMLLAEKRLELDRYAALRGMTEDELRDKYLSDVGLDEQGGKVYDLGNQTVTARLQKDLSFLFELPDGKTAKSLPKKGSDTEKYEVAKADFDEMRKAIKKIVKSRSGKLLQDFLSGSERSVADWTAVYLKNPLLRAVAELLVWEQGGRRFILRGSEAVDVDGKTYSLTDEPIRVAHPMEMEPKEVTAWQKYLVRNGVKQPFAQMWEPVIDHNTIKSDRYKGCFIPYYRFLAQEKHGIKTEDLDYHNYINISFAECCTEITRIDWVRHSIQSTDRFEVESFRFTRYSRQVNHIVSYLDRITVWDRVRKDDVSVMDQIGRFTLAQITEFIKVAQEANAVNVLALLLEYKNAHFADFDPMDEFTLEW